MSSKFIDFQPYTMTYYDLVVLTEDRYQNPLAETQYVKNLIFEDRLIADALKEQGLAVTRISWSDKHFDWSRCRYALFRTTWDYFERFEEFMSWMKATSEKLTFINSAKLAEWNLDKHYLQKLSKAELPVVPTVFAEPGSTPELRQIMKELQLDEVVIKPAVSGAGRHTYRVSSDDVEKYEHIFSQLTSSETMLIQPFVHSILKKGEISLMIFGGKYSHSVLKVAKPGEFRVQDDFGGTVHDYEPDFEAINLAEKAVDACPEPPLYARVDLVWFQDKWHLGELELIEPELFFRKKSGSATMLAKAIAASITS